MSSDQAERGQEWLEQLLQHCGWSAPVSSEPPAALGKLNEFGGCWLTIEAESLSPEQLEMLTSRNATVLDAVQYLLTSTLNLGNAAENREAYTLEVGDLRTQRYQEVAELALEGAATARQTGEDFEMPPLTSAERRLVHTVLYDETDVRTQSWGEEPDRRLVISCVTDDHDDELAQEI